MTHYTLTKSDVAETEKAYASSEIDACMAYAYAYGRMDQGSEARVKAPGVGTSMLYTASWFAHLYTHQEGVIQFGHVSAWENFEASNGEKITR